MKIILTIVFILLSTLAFAESYPSPTVPYIAQGYSIVGPVNVLAISYADVVSNNGPNNLSVMFTGNNVIAIDQYGRRLPISAVAKGRRVLLLRKGKNVVFMVLPDIASKGAR
jgi:hypothetical protein